MFVLQLITYTLDSNYATLETRSEKQLWKWYAAINEDGNYLLNDDDGHGHTNQQIYLSKSHAIASNFLFYFDINIFLKFYAK